jgi:tetratricopeptide (TPR) repeat protein
VKKCLYRIVAAGAAAVIIGCAPHRAIPGPGSVDHSTYGNAPFPFWCPLTKAELAVLQQADSARAGNADALLSLAIFASGDTRDSAGYALFRSMVRSFVARTRPGIDTIKNHKEKGRALYAALCREFYGTGFSKGTLREYRAEQSRLTELLRSRRYDCVSSALLCIIIFRYCGLNVSGVIVPSHFFVQYHPPSGEGIEIETCIKDGYDFRHDDRSFREGSLLAASLKLEPMTPEDYRNRRIVSPFQAVVHNMHNQHLKARHMRIEDRNRLYEARGHLVPDDTTAAVDRVLVYNNEFVRFDSTRDFDTALAMFTAIGPTLAPLLVRWRSVPSVIEKLALVWSYWTVTLARTGHAAAAIDKLDTLMTFVDRQQDNYPVLLQNVSYILDKMGSDYLKQERYEEAKAFYDRCRKKCTDTARMDGAYHYFYETLATALFRKGTYPKAVACYDTALRYAKKPEDRSRIYNNIQAAYCNMSLTAGPQAKRVLRECVEKYPLCAECRKRLESMP